jgi:hypothetical protein
MTISAGQDEMKNDIDDKISAIQGRITADQVGFREMAGSPDRQLNGITTMVELKSQKLREEFNGEIHVPRRDMETTRRNLEATRPEFESQLVAVGARTTRERRDQHVQG